jgi:hypothetical protein
MAEDSYILFKALELGYRAYFCTKTYVTIERTTDIRKEELYKSRTTLGIYQALKDTRPPPWVRTFYGLLPIAAPMLTLVGEDGKAWMRGIKRAIGMILTGHSPTKF